MDFINKITTRQMINVLVVLFILYLLRDEITGFFCKHDRSQRQLIFQRLPVKLNNIHLDTTDDYNTTMTDIMNPNRNVKYRLGY